MTTDDFAFILCNDNQAVELIKRALYNRHKVLVVEMVEDIDESNYVFSDRVVVTPTSNLKTHHKLETNRFLTYNDIGRVYGQIQQSVLRQMRRMKERGIWDA